MRATRSSHRPGRRSVATVVILVAVTMLAALTAPASSAPVGRASVRLAPAHHHLADASAASDSAIDDTSASDDTSAGDGVATPDAANVSPGCQLLSPSTELGPTSTVPASATARVISPSGGVWDVATASGLIYVVNGSGLSVYDTSGQLRRHDALPASVVRASSSGSLTGPNGVSQPVVSPAGDVYISSYYGQSVVEMGPGGQLIRTFDPGDGNPTNIFALHSSSGAWELGVSTTQRSTASYVYDTGGSVVGSAGLVAAQGSFLTMEPSGDILYANGEGFVQTWGNEANHLVSQFGSTEIHGTDYHTAGPLSFYYPDEAVLAHGSIYTADGLSNMTVTQPNGLFVGMSTLGGQLSLDGDLGVEGSDLVAQTGPPFDGGAGTVSLIPFSTVSSYLGARQPAADVLGWGAGLRSGVAGNYFAPGSAPRVTAEFAAWWGRLAPHLQLSYQVWSTAAINAEQAPTATTVRLPDTAAALAHVSLPFPSSDDAPGPYEVEAKLWDTATSPETEVGATCLPLTVGASGDRLDFSKLPAGLGSGGPQDPRGVALNAQLGLDGLRSLNLVDWSSLLPHCDPTAPSPSTCGPAAMQLASASISPFEAAGLAARDHVHYWIQVSGGDPISMALVTSGLWQADIQALVAHYTHVPSGCQGCAPVNAWEPWNEANNTGWADPQQYVTKVLEPFYKGAKAAQPTTTVIGGSSLEVAYTWWQGLIAAGGLAYLDVASVHPYPGSNDSWEEDGVETQLAQLKALLGKVPLWLTEVGWWSNGDYDFTHQANAVAHAMIWQRVIGIPVWNYFFDEGAFGNDGISFSLIQAADGASVDDYVKPAALAVMEASSQMTGRAVTGERPTGIPETWDARFGPKPGGTDDMAAIWSDGLPSTGDVTVTGAATVPVTVTNQYGATTSLTLRSGAQYALGLSDQVDYLSYPKQDQLTVGPPESYGTDLALASAGATATASSGDADAVLVDPADATGYGQGWTSATTDVNPTLTIRLGQPQEINRVIVDTQSSGSVAPGLRAYTLDVEAPDGTWTKVASPDAQFRHHEGLLIFDPIRAVAVRLTISSVNVGGYYGGGLPFFCSLTSCSSAAFVHAIEVYAGSAAPEQVSGTGLRPI